jgi:hypothetical protein
MRMSAAALSAAALCFGVLSLSEAPTLLHQLLAGLLYVVLYLLSTLVFKAWNQHDVAMLDQLGQRVPALRRLAVLLVPWARAT